MIRRLALLLTCCTAALHAQQATNAVQANLNDVPADLVVPSVEKTAPAAGHRVQAVTAGWESTAVHHTLYLPRDWDKEKAWPVIVEYAGNGNYRNKLGDVSDGSVEGCQMGYGLSGGQGFIWVSLPFVSAEQTNAVTWWGEVEQTKRYCLATVKDVCARYHGDPRRVVLCGFSRGAIACNYIGLHDDNIAALWCGMICHSHYEGEFKHPAPDQAGWPERLKRLGARPQFISQEGGTQKTHDAIASTGFNMQALTFATLPYPNHSTRWLLCDTPLRKQVRDWLADVVKQP